MDYKDFDVWKIKNGILVYPIPKGSQNSSKMDLMNKKGPAYDIGMWKGAPAQNFKRAKALRANMTPAELKLWEYLKGNSFYGLKFRRQHPIQNYIADFYCHKLELIIEVDGGYHENERQKEKDREREKVLKFQDIRIIRFTNEQVLNDIETVIEQLKTIIGSNFPTL